jgi:hypothetical protein
MRMQRFMTRQIDTIMREKGIWNPEWLAWRDRVCKERSPSGAIRTDPGMKVIQDLVKAIADRGVGQVRRLEPRPGSMRASGPMYLEITSDDPVDTLRTAAREVLGPDVVSTDAAAGRNAEAEPEA